MSASPSAAPAANAPSSSDRVLNFSAGPAVLPEPVLLQAREDLWNLRGTGVGVMEHSHRGKAFMQVHQEAKDACRRVGAIPDDFEILFLQGGATSQFAHIPMNFLPEGRTADYPDTGEWTKKAIKEARKFGQVNVAFEGSAHGYDHVPAAEELSLTPDAAYLHYCSNNTIYGTRYETPPATDAPLIADTSSEMYSRPLDWSKHAMVYAGAQKNLGPSGVVLVVVRKDFLATAADGLAMMHSYKDQAAKDSMLNTPPTFGIYVMGEVFKWIESEGGLTAMDERNRRKAAHVYDAIDGSGGFYQGVSRPECRSLMNVSFRTPDADTDAAFVAAAAEAGLSGLKGHRNAGGLRASIYNAFPEAGCRTLAEFMGDFARRRG